MHMSDTLAPNIFNNLTPTFDQRALVRLAHDPETGVWHRFYRTFTFAGDRLLSVSAETGVVVDGWEPERGESGSAGRGEATE
jgi:hypothetical protein